MKAFFYSSFLIFSFTFSLSAQITLTKNDVPQIGDSLTYYTDTLPVITSPGGDGPDQTWDFTQLTSTDTFGLKVISLDDTPNADQFPEANLAIETNGVFLYGQLTGEELLNLGTAIDVLGNGMPFLVRFDPPQQLFQFPTTFGTAYSSTYSFTVVAAGEDFDLPVDSVRFSRTTSESGAVDSYGTLTTPADTYEVLRLQVTSENADTLYAQVAGVWTPLQSLQSTDIEYRWLAKEGGNVMSIFLDQQGNVESVDWLASFESGGGEVMAPQAAFSFSDQGEGNYSFTDQSTNNPTSWSWDFDDGNTSDLQNPTHTFTTSGEYNVCLTASNSAGTNTSCQTISILLSSLETLKEVYGFRLYPNPVRGRLQLDLSYPGGFAPNISFYNFAGQQLYTRPLQGQLSVDTRHWPAGVLTFVVRSPEGKILGSGRVIKD